MSRAFVPLIIVNSSGVPAQGIHVTITHRDASSATVWQDATTNTNTFAQPLTSDAEGRVVGWLDRGAYTFTIQGAGSVPSYTEYFDAAPAGDGNIDSSWLPNGVIQASHIANGAVGASQIASGAVGLAQLSSAVLAPGIIVPYAGASSPTGWLLCDGSNVSRSTYSALFTAIGTAYGSGNGSTTFSVPDFRGRSPLGAGTGVGAGASGSGKPAGSGLSIRALGDWGGEESHSLSGAESGIAQHAHTINAAATGISLASVGTGISLGANTTGVSIQTTSVDHSHFPGNDAFIGVDGANGAKVPVWTSGGFSFRLANFPYTTGMSGANPHGHSVTDPGHGHTLTDPQHNHSITDPNHTHTAQNAGPTAAANAHNTTHPFTVVNYVVKI